MSTDHPGVCDAYAPPTDNPEDSGFCARCGMFDWRHADAVATALREVLAVFSRAHPTGEPQTTIGYVAQHPIHPDDYQRWQRALGGRPEPPKCPRCKGHGIVPDWTNWDSYHGEPKPKPCPDCTPKEPTP